MYLFAVLFHCVFVVMIDITTHVKVSGTELKVRPPEHAPQALLRVVLTLEAWFSPTKNTAETYEIVM
jgi:hypothetical protein